MKNFLEISRAEAEARRDATRAREAQFADSLSDDELRTLQESDSARIAYLAKRALGGDATARRELNRRWNRKLS